MITEQMADVVLAMGEMSPYAQNVLVKVARRFVKAERGNARARPLELPADGNVVPLFRN